MTAEALVEAHWPHAPAAGLYRADAFPHTLDAGLAHANVDDAAVLAGFDNGAGLYLYATTDGAVVWDQTGFWTVTAKVTRFGYDQVVGVEVVDPPGPRVDVVVLAGDGGPPLSVTLACREQPDAVPLLAAFFGAVLRADVAAPEARAARPLVHPDNAGGLIAALERLHLDGRLSRTQYRRLDRLRPPARR